MPWVPWAANSSCLQRKQKPKQVRDTVLVCTGMMMMMMMGMRRRRRMVGSLSDQSRIKIR